MNPTSYVLAAAHRAGGDAPAAAPAAGKGKGKGKGPGGVKRTWQETSQTPNASPTTEEGKKISAQLGWLNNSGILMERVSYSDVKEVLEKCGADAALKILNDLENSAGVVANPTNYIA